MAGPEEWRKARRELGQALDENERLTRERDHAAARSAETMDLVRESTRVEATLELARTKLDLALRQDRRARSAHEHANEMARRRGDSPDTLAPYTPDFSLAAAQAEFDAAQMEHERVELAMRDKERELRERFGLSPI